MEFILTGDSVKLTCIQAVDADVECGQTRVAPLVHVARQPVAIGGDRDLADRGVFTHCRNDVGEITAQRRLTTGQPHFFGSGCGESPRDAADFIQREKAFVTNSLRFVAVRKTIGTAEITDIRDRQAQVIELTRVCISKL